MRSIQIECDSNKQQFRFLIYILKDSFNRSQSLHSLISLHFIQTLKISSTFLQSRESFKSVWWFLLPTHYCGISKSIRNRGNIQNHESFLFILMISHKPYSITNIQVFQVGQMILSLNREEFRKLFFFMKSTSIRSYILTCFARHIFGQSNNNFSFTTYSSIGNARMLVCARCRPRSNACRTCKS